MSKIYDALQHLEAQRKAMETGATPDASFNPLDLQERPVTTPVSPAPAAVRVSAQPLLEQAQAVTRFGAELQRRMGEAGLNGIQGLFALAEQLQRALAVVSQPELDTAEADLERVANQVRSMQDGLRQLKAVKTDLEGMAGVPKA
jgi:hypothetical protein